MYPKYSKYWDRQAWSNSVDPDQMPQKLVTHMCLHLSVIQFLDASIGSKMSMLNL